MGSWSLRGSLTGLGALGAVLGLVTGLAGNGAAGGAHAVLLVAAVVQVVTGLAVVAVARGAARAADAVRETARRIADGDLTRRHQRAGGPAELARAAEALAGLADRLRDVLGRLGGTGGSLVSAARDLDRVLGSVAEQAQASSEMFATVGTSADAMARNIQQIAGGSEQMQTAIAEISANAHNAAQVATGAVATMELTTGTMNKLGESSRRIGDVMRLITSIAEQTNLLALNATIEAARAGSAGKGFAVVADEVKQLARETAKATDDISRRVETIQQDAEQATTSIQGVSQVIGQMNEFQATIAGAVEEQNATTRAINDGVAEAAQGSGRIAGTIARRGDSASRAVEAMSGASRHVQDVAAAGAELTRLAGQFRLGL